MQAAYYHFPELPWAMPEDEEQRYRKILKRTLILVLLLGLSLPFLPLPQVAREKVEELPPRLAQLLLEHRTPPPAPKVKEPELVKPETKPKPKKAEPKKATPKKKVATKRVETARAKAERSGLLAFKDDLADLRDDVVTSKLERTTPLKTGAKKASRTPQRALITSNARSGSGGINTARLSRGTGGGGLTKRGTTRVTSPVGDGGARGGTTRSGGSSRPSRGLEEIRLVFDRNKGSIYALYNRALRRDPTLQGKVVLKLTIAPSGQVTDCRIVSSELRSPALERKLLVRIRQFNFGRKNVDVMIVTYPIDFLPS